MFNLKKVNMSIKTLKKYDKSRLNGVLIRQVNILSDDTVKIISENGEVLEDWVEGANEFDFSADYILCELQNRTELKVSKY
jgi:hypothetical protein